MIPISRTIAENILINKHIIKALPIIDSINEKHIEEIAGNELRALKRYPVAYDLIVNLIHKAHKAGAVHSWLKDSNDYYVGTIRESTWQDYFKGCGSFDVRQSLARQVLHDLQSGFILIHGRDKKKGEFIEYRRPFFITAFRQYKNGEKERDLYFSKAVFQSLVTGECFKNGGDGFIEIPAGLYPKATHSELSYQIEHEGEIKTVNLGSHNPIYKINVYGLMKNTHKKDRIIIKRDDFIENVIPEYAKKDKIFDTYYLKKAEWEIHGALIKSIQQINKECINDRIVKNFYIGRDDVTLYFNNPK